MDRLLSPSAPGTAVDGPTKRMAAAILEGDRTAFNRFYDLYVDRLYRYLLVIAPRDEPLIREALQETMLRVLRHMKPFEREAVLWGWLTRVAKSVLFDLLRRQKRRLARETFFSDEPAATQPFSEETAEDRLMDALRNVLTRLSESERAIVESHYFQGLPQAALADEMGLSRKAVEGRIARVRRKMKTMILEVLGHE